jgi:hypothetical protein
MVFLATFIKRFAALPEPLATLLQYVEQEQAFADAGEGEAQVCLATEPTGTAAQTPTKWRAILLLQKRKIEAEGTKAAQKEGMFEKKGGEAEYVCDGATLLFDLGLTVETRDVLPCRSCRAKVPERTTRR